MCTSQTLTGGCGLLLEPLVHSDGFFRNVYPRRRHAARDLPVRHKPDFAAPVVGRIPPWGIVRAIELRVCPARHAEPALPPLPPAASGGGDSGDDNSDGDGDGAVKLWGLLWVRISPETRPGYAGWVVHRSAIDTEAGRVCVTINLA